jgi:nitrogen PTS system EIIA component
MRFGAALRLLRTDAGVSLRALAQQIGVSSAYLSRVENGHDPVPTPDRLVAIADVLKLPAPVLVQLANKVSPFVASYLERVPAAAALFAEIARRDLTGPQLARLRAFMDAEFPADAPQGQHAPPRLTSLLTPERVVLRLSCSHLEDALDVAAGRLCLDGKQDPAHVARALSRREQSASTALGEALAVPHAVVPGIEMRAAIITLAKPLPAATPDDLPLKVLVVLVFDRVERRELELLSQVARLAMPGKAEALAATNDARALIRRIAQEGL